MSDIVTLTFSPCLDKHCFIQAMIANQKLHCKDCNFSPGGGGINVARVISRLGGDALAIFPVSGDSGSLLCRLLQEENCKTLSVESAIETRENIIITERLTGNQYRFGMPSAFANDML